MQVKILSGLAALELALQALTAEFTMSSVDPDLLGSAVATSERRATRNREIYEGLVISSITLCLFVLNFWIFRLDIWSRLHVDRQRMLVRPTKPF